MIVATQAKRLSDSKKSFYSVIMNIIERLKEDVRFGEGLKACMNCGVCTAICPAAEFFDYDPRMIVSLVQSHDEKRIEDLLKSDTIWYCGQCMSCKTRCPRNNCPGMVIQALRKVSQEMGYFMESERGRQQITLRNVIGSSILERGYCVHPKIVKPELHPEQGPVWEWVYENMDGVFKRFGADINKEGPGAARKIDSKTMAELKAIFDETGGSEMFKTIDKYGHQNDI